MIEKQFGDLIRVKVNQSEETFRRHAKGLKVSFDEHLLASNLPPTIGVGTADHTLLRSLDRIIPEATKEAIAASEFVGVYGRIVEDPKWPDARCLQYMYVWDYQGVPPHEADYEPVFVYLPGKGEPYAIYDLVHYCTRRLDLRRQGSSCSGLMTVPGWHSFLPAHNVETSSLDRDLRIQPLTDQHLMSWWSIPSDESRFKIQKSILDPFSLTAPGHFLDKPDEASTTMCCTFSELERALKETDDPRAGLVEGIKRSLTGCVGVMGLFRLAAFLQLLGEMHDVGMVSIPAGIRTGLSLPAITEMLTKGLVSFTNAGRNLIDGLTRSYDDEEE